MSMGTTIWNSSYNISALSNASTDPGVLMRVVDGFVSNTLGIYLLIVFCVILFFVVRSTASTKDSLSVMLFAGTILSFIFNAMGILSAYVLTVMAVSLAGMVISYVWQK